MDKSPEVLYEEREKRVNDAVQIKVPDRVPVLTLFGFLCTKYAGVTCQELMYDDEKLHSVGKRMVLDFEPDMYENPHTYILSGRLLDSLDYKQLKWPGHGIGPNHTFQYLDLEYMRGEEYDDFIYDPSDWILRRYFPRTCGRLEAFEKLTPFRRYHYYNSMLGVLASFGIPEVADAVQNLLKAGKEAFNVVSRAISFDSEMKALGFPAQFAGSTHAPFDAIGDALRGTRGIMLDIHRRADKLLDACEQIIPLMIEMGVAAAKRSGVPRVFIPLHKGPEGFMSLKQFETFYWPGLKRVMEGLIDAGLTPCPFFEGDYTSRLEIIADIPKGKAIYHFERTDLFKAKEILGDHICIRGNVPFSLLQAGTPSEVKEYCKKLIDKVGRGGGYIMDAAGVMDTARPENVKAMIDYTKEYGVYS